MIGNKVPRGEHSGRSGLRVFSGGDADSPDEHGLWPGMSLVAFYRAYVKQVCLLRARSRNVAQYEESLGLWESLTGDPPLPQIDEFVCAEFVRGVALRPGRDAASLSDNTVRKHCIPVQYCLDRAGPYSRRSNPFGKGLLADPPLLPKPSIVTNDVTDNFLVAEISQWLAVCHQASTPQVKGVSPKDWWQSLILFDYNVGLRLETLLAARYDWLIEEDDGHWLQVPADAIKGKKRGRKFFVNAHALAAIESIRTDRELIFPWQHSANYLQAKRRELLAKTEIRKHRRFGFHGLRKALATELGKISEIASKMAMGHAGGDVTIGCYQHRVIYVEASKQLPQPVWSRDRNGSQRLLF